MQPSLNETKSFMPINNNTDVPSSTITSTKPPSTLTKTTSFNDHTNENLITLITEQRRQNRLLEQVIAAVNTTNALLTQLVQR